MLLAGSVQVAAQIGNRYGAFAGPSGHELPNRDWRWKMLTRLVVRNFKRFREIDVELGERVVFIGPNNSGKTTALQALALWNYGAKQWSVRRNGKSGSEKRRSGVTIGRKELLALPHPNTNQLWRDTQTRNIQHIDGRQKNGHVRIDVSVNGITNEQAWECGLEFDYANPEFIYCRPMKIRSEDSKEHMPFPEQAPKVKVIYLPPMSGLAETEVRLELGAINVRIGEGRTAEVLRNLCWNLAVEDNGKWDKLTETIRSLFGVTIQTPRYMPERGEIVMEYREHGVILDLLSSGRGLQQTLLIVACMISNPESTVLLDEPDAHLEVLRQRQIYSLLDDMAHESGSQIIAASHSEILLNEAAEKDTVIAFVGTPHRIGRRKSQVRKALAKIGYDQFLLAEQTGWVLYVEGPTDLAILRAFAKRLGHNEAVRALEIPFVHYVRNTPKLVADHFFGLMEAIPHLKGAALFDSLKGKLPRHPSIAFLSWKKREIENYLSTRGTFENFAKIDAINRSPGDIFTEDTIEESMKAMHEAMERIEQAVMVLEKKDPWSSRYKVSDKFIGAVLSSYYENLNQTDFMRKANFHTLVEYIPDSDIDPEIREKLDAIVAVAESAEPMLDEM